MDIAELGLVIRSDGVVVAKNRLRDFDHQAGLTEKRAAQMGAVVGRALGVIGAALGIRELVGYADAWSDMQSRVGAAIKDMDAAPAMMQRMVDLANASYSPLNQTVEVYSRNVGILRDLGYSANEAADFTEALNHSLVITATRGERAASVQNALSKAMATGRLQAEGLETVLANGGRVAEAIADELDTTVSGLRKMASEGRITGDVIARAMTGRLSELREEAAKMPATIGDAFTRIQTNLTALIGTFDKTHEVSGRVAEVILVVADNLEAVIPVAGAVATVLTVAMIPAIATTTAGWIALTAAMLANPFVQVGLLAGALAGTLLYLNQQQGMAAQAAQAHAEALTTNANAIEVAKTSSQGFRDGLRSQISLQLASARAALEEAGAQYKASAARAQFAQRFGDTMSIAGQMLGVSSREEGAARTAEMIAYQTDNALKNINDAYQRTIDLEGQLAQLANVEAKYPAVEHARPDAPLSKSAIKAAEAYKDLMRGAQEFIASQQIEQQALGMTSEAAARLRNEHDLLLKAQQSNLLLTPALRNEIASYASQMAIAEQQTKLMTQAANDNAAIWGQAQDGVSGIIKTWARGGDVLDTISNKLLNIGDMLIDMAVRDLFGSAFGGGMGGGGGGGIFSFLGGLFGGFRANGGPVQSGMAYMVGERGPELFSPSVSGRIIPNHSLPSANQNGNDNRRGDLHLHINGSGLDEQQLARAIANGIRDYDEALAPKVEAKFRSMQNDPRAADGSW